MAQHLFWRAVRHGDGTKWAFSPTQHLGCASISCAECGAGMCLDGASAVSKAKKKSAHGGLIFCYACTKNLEFSASFDSKRLSGKKCLFCLRMSTTEADYNLGVCSFCDQALKNGFAERGIPATSYPTTTQMFRKWLSPGPPPFSDFPRCSCNSCRHAGVAEDNGAH